MSLSDDSMVCNSDRASAESPRVSEDQLDFNSTSMSDKNEPLLKALQDFIVPLVRSAGHPTRENDLDQRSLGPEAMKLIIALKEFVSGIIVSSKLGVKTTVEVGVDVNEEDHILTTDKNIPVDVHSEIIWMPEMLSSESIEGEITSDNPRDQMVSEPIFREKLLRALREHVFNKMPIRLLCFNARGSNLQISLLERAAIYTHLASIVEECEPDYRCIFRQELLRVEKDDEAIERLLLKYARYAILSHTWLRAFPGEVTYSDWNSGLFDRQELGYRKLINFCKTAFKDHRLTLGWMDTVCINKDSSSELDESIRSMFNWYERANICIVYLAETNTLSDMHLDQWFTRGWTLQELLAPKVIKFYNHNWKKIADNAESFNDKTNSIRILEQIEKATTIGFAELNYIDGAPLSRRMELAATREVTREEDAAYSLMGIFDVSIATAYGEGAERALSRLLQGILNGTSAGILDLFNWASTEPSSSASCILPSNLQYYRNRSSSIDLEHGRPLEPLTLTHMGIRIHVLLLPGISHRSTFTAIGDYSATVNISVQNRWNPEPIIHTYRLLDSRIFDSNKSSYRDKNHSFAVFNIGQGMKGISIPKICIAIALECSEDSGRVTSMGRFRRIQTNESIIFTMDDKHGRELDRNEIEIPVDQLAAHGMQLVSLYL